MFCSERLRPNRKTSLDLFFGVSCLELPIGRGLGRNQPGETDGAGAFVLLFDTKPIYLTELDGLDGGCLPGGSKGEGRTIHHHPPLANWSFEAEGSRSGEGEMGGVWLGR